MFVKTDSYNYAQQKNNPDDDYWDFLGISAKEMLVRIFGPLRDDD